MLVSNTLWVLILAILPIILYSYLVYFLVPKNFISTHRARRYLVAGFLSPMLINLFYFLFPNWGDPQSSILALALLILAFLQVGVLEESAKFVTFWWVSKERSSEKYDLPIATMFYSMMSAVGFAITENIFYLIREQRRITEIQKMVPFDLDISRELLTMAEQRSLTAVIAHMICGVIMGYFLAKAHNYQFNSPLEDNTFLKNKNILYGIIAAASFHGVYDYNLFLEDNTYAGTFAIIILIFGLVIGRFIINDLIKESILFKEKQQTINCCKVENEIKEQNI